MLRSPSSLRSLLHLSGRLLRPSPLHPPLPSSARSHRPRFFSSSSSPTPGGARWATNDHDPLIESLCASASDTPMDSDVWAVFDPVAGRIVVIQRPPPSSSSTEEEDEEREGEGEGEEGTGEREGEGEEKLGVKETEKWKRNRKGRASASGEKGQIGRPSVVAARKPAGKGSKEKVSYVCLHCGESHLQWRGTCRHCKALGTLLKIWGMVLHGDGGPSEEEVEEGEAAGERDEKEKAGVKEEDKNGEGKGKGKTKGRACASGEKSQTRRSSVAAARKPSRKDGKEKVSYVCFYCEESYSQWWGTCRHCKALGTVLKTREMVLQGDGGPSEEEVEEGEGAGECNSEEKAGVREKRRWKRKGGSSASCEKGQTSPPLVVKMPKSAGKGSKVRAWYVCSNCKEGHPRWWGCCRHCNAVGTLTRSREMVPPSFQEVN